MRLDTKAKRIELQNYFFQSLENKGFTREDYKDLIIWTLTSDKLEYQIFRGTATKPLCYYSARSLESLTKGVQGYKDSADRREAYKVECKTNKTKSTAANAAAAIRAELKTAFPDIKFSVTSDNFAGGDAVRVSWADGATDEQVNNIVKKYQYGSFNGMEDIYEYTNTREDLPQSKYVSTSRTISEEINETVFNSLKSMYSEDVADYVINQDKYRLISKSSIPVGAIVTGVESTNQSGILEDCFRLVLDVTNVKNIEKETVQQKQNFKAAEVPAGTVQIIEYSEKAIAVIGETKPIKEGLKTLGGSFNFRLTCGAGWIFPKSKLEEVTAFLSKGVKTEIQSEEKTTLKDEVQKTIEFLAETDVKIYGEVTEGTKEAAKVQNVDLYDKNEITIYKNVEDLENAAQNGKVISLLNYSNLINKRQFNC